MESIYQLYAEVKEYGGLSAAYYQKMIHQIPEAPSIKRESYLLDRARGKNILDVGCVGPMGAALQSVCSAYYGMDIRQDPDRDIDTFIQVDLDNTENLPEIPDLDLVIAAEVIEHLSNAGHFLDLIRAYQVPVVLTTPNAMASVVDYYLGRGVEQVNSEHVAWYSWYTLTNLVERHNFSVVDWYWYNGPPIRAEGLIFSME